MAAVVAKRTRFKNKTKQIISNLSQEGKITQMQAQDKTCIVLIKIHSPVVSIALTIFPGFKI